MWRTSRIGGLRHSPHRPASCWERWGCWVAHRCRLCEGRERRAWLGAATTGVNLLATPEEVVGCRSGYAPAITVRQPFAGLSLGRGEPAGGSCPSAT